MIHKVLLRSLLSLLAISSLLMGIWATLSPRSFFMSFPVPTMHWVASAGPYEKHLVSDFGSLNLAMATLAIFAIYYLEVTLTRATAAGFLVYGVLHVLFHLENRLPSSANQLLQVTALLVPVFVAISILMLSRSRSSPTMPRIFDSIE